MNHVKIKICGLRRPEDIAYVNEALPDYCGFVINVPKSRRCTTPDQVRTLRRMLSPEITPVGVFVNEASDTVAKLLLNGIISVAQLHGEEDENEIRMLQFGGAFPVWKAFRVPDPGSSEEEIVRWADQVEKSPADLVLLDRGGGGTGKTFDWSFARRIRRPYLLAGGIGAENVTEALDALHPWGVDMSSSVETEGVKDREKILAAVSEVREWNNRREA